ncbi:MAG: hypothetical protein IKK33_06880 [Lachnospiraceae bacterium]|nr:hypothetical protein [Lachnospiraceae bacterium]
MARIGLSVAILQEDKKDIRKLLLQMIRKTGEYGRVFDGRRDVYEYYRIFRRNENEVWCWSEC